MSKYSPALSVLLFISCFGCDRKPLTPQSCDSWKSISTPLAKEGPDNSYVISAIIGEKSGCWKHISDSNIPPETSGSVSKIGLPYTDYGYRLMLYESDKGAYCLHLYVREVQRVNSPSKGPVEYKFNDMKSDLIGKFKDGGEWEVLTLTTKEKTHNEQ